MVDSEGGNGMNDAGAGPRATVVTGVTEDAIPALFAAASCSSGGIDAALDELRSSSVALAVTPPLGLAGIAVPLRSPGLTEHATLHLAIENVSLLAARALQDSRLVSTVLPPELAVAAGMIEPSGTSDALRAKVRAAGTALQRAYLTVVERAAQRLVMRDRATPAGASAAARDLALGLVPAATRTNVYLSANARVLAGHCQKLLSHPLAEVVAVGHALLDAARFATPDLFAATQPSKMRAAVHGEMADALARLYAQPQEGANATMVISQPVRLVRHDKDALERVVLALAYEASDAAVHAFALTSSLRAAKEPALAEVLRAILRERAPGEHVPRGFEASTMTFEIMADAATAADLLRHRTRAVSVQRLGCRLGFQTPEDLLDLSLADLYQDAMLAAQASWAEIEAEDANAAEYTVPLGDRVRSLWTLDLRQLVHIVEARSTKDNPTRVRRIAHALYRTATAILPWLRDVARVDLD